MRRSQSTSGINSKRKHPEAFLIRSEDYSKTNTPAIRDMRDGSSFVYYPNGRVAMSVTRVSKGKMVNTTTYVYNNDRKMTMLATFNHFGHGHALQFVKKQPCQTLEGGLHRPIRRTNDPNIPPNRREWKLSKCDCKDFKPTATLSQACATCGHSLTGHYCGLKFICNKKGYRLCGHNGSIVPPREVDKETGAMKTNWTVPYEMELNPNLKFVFKSRNDIVITFTCQNITKSVQMIHKGSFERPAKWRRPDSWRRVARMDESQLKHPEVKSLMNDLEAMGESMKTLFKEINYIDGADTLDRSRKAKLKKTLRNGSNNQPVAASSTPSSPSHAGTHDDINEHKSRRVLHQRTLTASDLITGGDSIDKLDEKLLSRTMTKKGGTWLWDERKALQDIKDRNPLLSRSEMIRFNSGKYCLEVPVPDNHLVVKKLRLVNSTNFDRVVAGEPKKLTVICCVADWTPSCNEVQQSWSLVNGSLPADTPFLLYKFDLSESRFMIEKYNMRLGPAVLMYYDGKLVHAQVTGGRVYNCRMVKPRVLLIEQDFLSQIRLEKTCRQLGADHNLALGIRDVRAFGGRALYSILVIDLDLPENEIHAIISLVKAAPPRSRPYIIGMLTDGKAVLGCNPDVTLIKPVGHAAFSDELRIALDLCEPKGVAHTGVSQKDFKDLMKQALDKGRANQFMPANFRFR